MNCPYRDKLSDVNNLEWKKNNRSLKNNECSSCLLRRGRRFERVLDLIGGKCDRCGREIGVEDEACLTRAAECNYVS